MKFDFKNIGGIAIILIVILCFFLCFIIFNKDKQEEELNNILKSLGSEFYEEFYYDKVGNNIEERKIFRKI